MGKSALRCEGGMGARRTGQRGWTWQSGRSWGTISVPQRKCFRSPGDSERPWVTEGKATTGDWRGDSSAVTAGPPRAMLWGRTLLCYPVFPVSYYLLTPPSGGQQLGPGALLAFGEGQVFVTRDRLTHYKMPGPLASGH